MQDFTKLRVWDRASRLAVRIDHESRTFPASGYGWLAAQMRRSSASVAANIAEGCGRDGPREFARFLQMAPGSALETRSHVSHAAAVGIIARRRSMALDQELCELGRMLNRLIQRVRASKSRHAGRQEPITRTTD